VQIAKYRGRLSGPLRDRIDLIVEVPAVPVTAIADAAPGEPSAMVRERVCAARRRQQARSGDEGPRTNAALRGRVVGQVCRPDADGKELLKRAVDQLALSARGYDRVLKVARTIADLEGAERVAAAHVAEALQYRLVE
jgi:magnesium chelatase family protein